jgi:hypothetical protein
MSATLIRKIIYDMDPHTNYVGRVDLFRDRTKRFYETNDNDYTNPIFDAINAFHPFTVVSGSDKIAIKATKSKSIGKQKKGGSKRRKLTKRKRKTKRKRSKLTKRRKTKRQR